MRGPGHVAAVDPEGLAQRAHQDVDRRARREFLGAPSGAAKGADAMGIVHHQKRVFREALVEFPNQSLDLPQGSVVATHAENAVGHHHRPPRSEGRRFLQGLFEFGEPVVPVDELLLRPGQPHGVDDAVVIELIRDERRLAGDQGDNGRDDGGVGGREDQGGLAGMKRRQPGFESEVRLIGAADETHRAGPAAKSPDRRFLRLNHAFAQAHAEVVVGVHLEERGRALPLEQIPRPVTVPRRHHLHDDRFVALAGSATIDGRDLGAESLGESMKGHVRRRIGAVQSARDTS